MKKKCESCGSTDINLQVETGKLRCNVCRKEQAEKKFQKEVTNISTLEGLVKGAGASEIIPSEEELLTLKCGGCGAEVVIDTSEALQATCHWCRHTLSVTNQIPNGAVPDKIVPFTVTKNQARTAMEAFVAKRKFWAHPRFKREIDLDGIYGVYLPYMVIDAYGTGQFKGISMAAGLKGGIEEDPYYYTYALSREFSLTVENLTIESKEAKRNKKSNDTVNVINAIKPFDMTKAMEWNPYYMRGFSSQRRDTNVDELSEKVNVKIKDIARHQLKPSIQPYIEGKLQPISLVEGVRWDAENLTISGRQWKAAYLPVWLYSYQHKDKSMHYIAVNGQNEKAMGSVPINKGLLALVSPFAGGIPIAILGAVLTPIVMIWQEIYLDLVLSGAIGAVMGFILGTWAFYTATEAQYRNKEERYEHESVVNANIYDLVSQDEQIGQPSEDEHEQFEPNHDAVYYQ